jgi:hypothetical protein
VSAGKRAARRPLWLVPVDWLAAAAAGLWASFVGIGWEIVLWCIVGVLLGSLVLNVLYRVGWWP